MEPILIYRAQVSERLREKEGRGMRTYTKILTLSGWFILVGYALTPHMWDEQNEP